MIRIRGRRVLCERIFGLHILFNDGGMIEFCESLYCIVLAVVFVLLLFFSIPLALIDRTCWLCILILRSSFIDTVVELWHPGREIQLHPIRIYKVHGMNGLLSIVTLKYQSEFPNTESIES